MSADVTQFDRDGFVALRGAVPLDVVAGCRAAVATALAAEGIDVGDPATWTRPVARLMAPDPSMVAAARSERLAAGLDGALGKGRWQTPMGVVGSVVVRFPHHDGHEDPADTGWHLDGSYAGLDGQYWINSASRGRAGLALFLLSDVGPDDAPTEVLVGSHLDVPAVLEPFGDEGASFMTVAQSLPASTLEREVVPVTGTAGDVFVCHPFLVHRATWPHRGTTPRIISQPAILPTA